MRIKKQRVAKMSDLYRSEKLGGGRGMTGEVLGEGGVRRAERSQGVGMDSVTTFPGAERAWGPVRALVC